MTRSVWLKHRKGDEILAKIKKSFYEWCVENNHEDYLELWDYELIDCSPKDVSWCSGKKYWFKCPKGIHKSEQKYMPNLTTNKVGLICKQCNSFGQWWIDTYEEDALE